MGTERSTKHSRLIGSSNDTHCSSTTRLYRYSYMHSHIHTHTYIHTRCVWTPRRPPPPPGPEFSAARPLFGFAGCFRFAWCWSSFLPRIGGLLFFIVWAGGSAEADVSCLAQRCRSLAAAFCPPHVLRLFAPRVRRSHILIYLFSANIYVDISERTLLGTVHSTFSRACESKAQLTDRVFFAPRSCVRCRQRGGRPLRRGRGSSGRPKRCSPSEKNAAESSASSGLWFGEGPPQRSLKVHRHMRTCVLVGSAPPM